MNGSGKETKSSPIDKSREKLLLSFCVLSFVGVCLTIALFVRTEMKFKQMEAVFLSNGKSLVSAKDEGEHNSTGKCIHMLISIWTLHTFRLSGHIRYGGGGVITWEHY